MSNINEALARRKTHMAVKYILSETTFKIVPLCNQSEEATIRKYGDLKLTGSKNVVTCKRCIRSLTGSYNR